mmetsp:Transcript_58964/g.125253  ORF Transcript_58964/g.125253 Transcript_58964/m.125253 type:complete len:87 (-) Transcript_58964:2797-3057(-)
MSALRHLELRSETFRLGTRMAFSTNSCLIFFRKAIIDAASSVHHDFGPFNQSLAVSLLLSDLEDIKSNPNVEWYEGDGRVIYCSIR